MKVKIFTEGGSDIGLGHISRCSSLYDEITNRKIFVEFLVHGDIENIDFLANRNFKNVEWLSEEYLNYHICNNDYCIVDSYIASEDLYKIISNKSKKSLFIDDNVRIKYPKGIILNPSLIGDDLSYPIHEESIYLLGSEYVILRRSFVNAERNIINKDVKEVLITMGGADIRGLTPKIISGICEKYPKVEFNIVIGSQFCNVDYIKNKELENVTVYHDVNEDLMKTLMLKSDFSITAAGQTIYELIATKTPFIPIRVINNQNNNIRGLLKINQDQVIIDYDDELLVMHLKKEFELMLDIENRKRFIKRYENIIDGLGSKKIIDRLLAE